MHYQLIHVLKISDLITNYGGSNWIDKEVEGTLVAVSDIVHADGMSYVKVLLKRN